ncbi:PREDICTED: zinc metalloproteinase nas-4-like [Wasmannia auropunctata]|uniref:zinc metalloproteinase nas-4-like n=1 Tax=Wasmannia auropunctata TaxID=64793 RepID=UPI0005F0C0CC|nr:PREDICTED: zinc metalloproteinase nas-4-like [Wasmannia auropunctata]
MKMNPEELGNYFEGDIMISNSTTRNGDTKAKRWPGGIIPYTITGSYTKAESNNIIGGINEINMKLKGCIRLVKRTNQINYINIKSENVGCRSPIGMQGTGEQEVNLHNGCAHTIGTPMHEITHAMGFWHEQSRYDRDSYVKIKLENVEKGHEKNFEKARKGRLYAYGVPYDYGSVMHYSAYAFAKDKSKPTIVTTDKNAQEQIGQRKGYSRSDIIKIKRMYGCK